MTNRTHRSVAIGALGVAFAIGACSSAPAAPATAPAAAPATAPGGDASVVPELTPAPVASTGTGTSTGGGDGACANTIEEVSTAFAVKVTEAEVTGDANSTACTYYTDKAAFEAAMATTFQRGGMAKQTFESYASDSSSERVSGIGDDAIWFGGNSIFMVLKGDAVLSMSAGLVPIADDDAAVRKVLEDLARLAADRL